MRRRICTAAAAVLLPKKLYFLDRYASQGTLLAANLEGCTNLVLVYLSASISVHENQYSSRLKWKEKVEITFSLASWKTYR